MQEYQALAQAAVVALQAGATPTWAYLAGPVVAGLVGIGQCYLIARGINAMKESSEVRDKAHERRHQESMVALKALIERTSSSQVRVA